MSQMHRKMDTKTTVAVIVLTLLFLWHIGRAFSEISFRRKRKKINYGKPLKRKKDGKEKK